MGNIYGIITKSMYQRSKVEAFIQYFPITNNDILNLNTKQSCNMLKIILYLFISIILENLAERVILWIVHHYVYLLIRSGSSNSISIFNDVTVTQSRR